MYLYYSAAVYAAAIVRSAGEPSSLKVFEWDKSTVKEPFTNLEKVRRRSGQIMHYTYVDHDTPPDKQ